MIQINGRSRNVLCFLYHTSRAAIRNFGVSHTAVGLGPHPSYLEKLMIRRGELLSGIGTGLLRAEGGGVAAVVSLHASAVVEDTTSRHSAGSLLDRAAASTSSFCRPLGRDLFLSKTLQLTPPPGCSASPPVGILFWPSSSLYCL